MKITLAKWAKLNGYSYRGAYNRFHRSGIPNSFINETGRIFVDISNESSREDYIVTYARVSSHKQKEDLERQSRRISDFCASRGMIVQKAYKEIASGLNDDRKILNDIFSSDKITTVVVENKDRLTRFGFNYLSKFSGKNVIVMNLHDEEKDDLMQDLISIITSMTARYYGKRRSASVKKKIKEALDDQGE